MECLVTLVGCVSVIVGKVGNYSKYRWVLVNIIPFYSLETEVSRVVKYSHSLNNMWISVGLVTKVIAGKVRRFSNCWWGWDLEL